MSEGFTIGAASGAPTIFSCPSCNETIDVSTAACRFCGAPVNADFARHAAEVLARINQACSDASYMKTCALALGAFFLIRLVPFFSMVGAIGFIGLLVGVPVWAVIWSVRYGSIDTADADFLRAKKTVRLTGIIVTSLFVVFVLVPFFYGLFRALHF